MTLTNKGNILCDNTGKSRNSAGFRDALIQSFRTLPTFEILLAQPFSEGPLYRQAGFSAS